MMSACNMDTAILSKLYQMWVQIYSLEERKTFNPTVFLFFLQSWLNLCFPFEILSCISYDLWKECGYGKSAVRNTSDVAVLTKRK